MPYLRLIRLPNLLIVAFTQYLLEFLILIPAFESAKVLPILDLPRFILLVCSTLLIAAGGYVINDIEDIETDRINKPDKQIVGNSISVKQAYTYYFVLFFIGLAISFYLATYINNLPLLSIYPLAWLLLYVYSRHLKKMPLWGNFTVAIFCAFVAGIVWFAERAAYFSLVESTPQIGLQVSTVFGIYLFFAFISTLYREIIKDMEDYQGDAASQCRTFPIAYGMRAAKALSFFIGMIFFSGLVGLVIYLKDNTQNPLPALLFSTIAMLFPLVYSLQKLYFARTKSDYKMLSRSAKLLMLSGILLLFFL